MNAIIVQARVGSRRLKEKTLLPLSGKPLIFRIIERLKKVKNVKKIILAIPDTKKDNKIVKVFKNEDIIIFRGSENNLVERHYLAAKKYNVRNIIRFPGDNCIPEPKEIDRIIKYYESFKKPFFATNLSNVFNNGYPDGIGAEIFGFNFLDDLINKNLTKFQLEHPHINFLNYSKNEIINNKWCTVRTIRCPKRIRRPEIRLDVNTSKDYSYIKKIYDSLYFKNHNFDISSVIKFIDRSNKKITKMK